MAGTDADAMARISWSTARPSSLPPRLSLATVPTLNALIRMLSKRLRKFAERFSLKDAATHLKSEFTGESIYEPCL